MASSTTNIGLVKPDKAEGLDIAVLNGNSDKLDEEIMRRATTLNGVPVDEHGGFVLNTVQFARQLVTEDEQESAGEYIIRAAGGSASLASGEARLVAIRGRRVHTGYQEESIEVSVTSETITGTTVDRETFVSYVPDSATISLNYIGVWSTDPALYGIEITGEPENGDTIQIVYVKGELGTITVATPNQFRSTGWNLYNHTLGYAQVVKYSEQYGFKIEGTYTMVQFSETLSGTKMSLPVTGGAFNVPSDGYVWVIGGNATDTVVYMTWSDWASEGPEEFEAYTESTINLGTAMQNFPNGLMQVGAVYDEINLNTGKAYSRISRMTYSEANLEAAQSSGRAYEYDAEYIYIVRETPIEYSVTLDGTYTVSDHGMEAFDGTLVPVYAATLYGQNLVDKLRTDVLTKSAQELSSTEKGQVLANFGLTLETLAGGGGNAAVSAGYVSGLNASANFSQIRIYRFGKIVMLVVYISNTTAALIDQAVLFTLASSVRPVYGFGIPLLNGNRRVYNSKGVQIASNDGTVKLELNSQIEVGTELRFMATYLTA